MKTATFSAVVQAAGTPTTHLLLVAPEKDKVLQAAIKGRRVMTLHQRPTGSKADYGTVGFAPGGACQYLIFPKSLSEFQENAHYCHQIRVAGRFCRPGSHPGQGRCSSRRKRRSPRSHVDLPSPREKGAGKDSTRSKPALEKVVHFATPEPAKEPDEEGDAIREIKNQVRRAMDMLEEGKQVAAFNLLKRIVDL